MPQPLTVIPVSAPVQDGPFDLVATLRASLRSATISLQDGDVLAISSKYAAIAAGRVINLANVAPSPQARCLAARYQMDPAITELVLAEADQIFGGIELGFLLTSKGGVVSPNAGLDRSNIPSGQAVLLPEAPFQLAESIRGALQGSLGSRIGVILTDSWLMPGRYGTTGVAIAIAGFEPIKDERGKRDLFGNAMSVTQIGVADSLAVCAQVVMGERDEATPFALVRGADIDLTDAPLSAETVSIPWRHCIYIESLTVGLLPAAEPSRQDRYEAAK
ncbi:MAG: coenzyme F420-0:L-glutamate ligase [Chloroflexota bacterium]|nr:coenzyme F420-0:L-glutamate ligase [Chloroflexota bacterium]MDE2948250.1 coenzyme F420-0:L-glutamate ligase [Chloroflexota bacterium]